MDLLIVVALSYYCLDFLVVSYKNVTFCRFMGGYTNIIFTYSSFVAYNVHEEELIVVGWILRATISDHTEHA